MVEKSIMNFSRSECLKASKEALKKSRQGFIAAEVLAKTEDYDHASALLITSNENLIKGFILYMDGIGFSFRTIKGMNSLYNNHKLRYLLGFLLSVFSIFERDLKLLLLKCVRNPKLASQFKFDDPAIMTWLKDYILKRTLQIKAEVEFFSKLDRTRQQGVYSDFDHAAELITISPQKYKELHIKIASLNSIIYMIMGAFTNFPDDEIKKYFQKLKVDFKKKYNQHIEILLSKINKSNVKSYETMQEAIEEFYIEIVETPNLNGLMDETNETA